MTAIQAEAALRALVDHLRAGAPIGHAEREMLADGISTFLIGTAPLDRALGLVGAPGQRTVRTIAKLEERDDAVRQLAAEHYTGLRKHQAAARISGAWAKYASSAWPRERLLDEVPTVRLGKPEATIWQIMKLQDLVLSERSIRRILATS